MLKSKLLHEKYLIYYILILGFTIRLALLLKFDRITNDSLYYIILSKSIHRGDIEFLSHIKTPMLYPLLLSYSYCFNIPIGLFGQIINLILGTSCIFLIYLITNKIFNNRMTSIISSFLTAIYPQICISSSEPMREIPGLFFALTAIYIFIFSEKNYRQKNALLYYFLTGLSLGIAILFRLEHIEILISVLIYFLLTKVFIKCQKGQYSIYLFLLKTTLIIAGLILVLFTFEFYASSKGLKQSTISIESYLSRL